MLTASNRELFLLQSKTNLRHVEKIAKQAKQKESAVSSATMVYVDADAEKVHMIDPCAAFSIPPHIAAQHTQLHLGNKGINTLHPNTMLFVSLETMILSDNRLSKLTGLLPTAAPTVTTAPTGCSRIKRLILTNNRIVSLKGDLENLYYVEVLLLGNNLLSNMERVSRQLQHLHYLKQLDLSKNPVCEEHAYRLYMIHRHPSLEQLDRQTITQEERREAAAMFGRAGSKKAKLSSGNMSGASSVASSVFPSLTNKTSCSGASGTAGRGEAEDDASGPKKAYAFGGTYRVHDKEEMHKLDGGMSGSAALLESKVRAILLKRHADTVREQTKAQTQLDEIVERRQMFHTLWEWSGQFLTKGGATGDAVAAPTDAPPGKAPAKPAKGAVPVSPSPASLPPPHERHLVVPMQLQTSSIQTTEPHQSTLFVDGCAERFPNLEPMLDRVRHLLRAEADKRPSIAEELRKHLHHIIPERPGDGFNSAFTQWKHDRLPDAVQQYVRQCAQSLIAPSESSALLQLFGSMEAAVVDVDAWGPIVNALDDAGKAITVDNVKRAFRSEFNLPESSSAGAARKTSVLRGVAKGGHATSTFAISVEQAMQLLVRYLPFVATRPQYFQERSAAALREGQQEAAMKYLQLMNTATDHHRLIVRCLPSGSDRGECVFVPITMMPKP